MRLNGKRAIIMSATGKEVVTGIQRRFEREGAKVALVSPDKLSKAASQSAIATAIAGLAGVDILVTNTIPDCAMGPLEDKDETLVDKALSSVATALWAMQAAFPTMKSQKWGRIITLGSRYGQGMNIYNGEYNAATAALYGLTRTAAAEWGRLNIRVNMLETAEDSADFDAYKKTNPAAIEALVSQTALGRRGDPEQDIGAAAVMLACDEGDWINGIKLCADGGQHIAAPAFVPAIHMGFSSRG